MTSSKFGQIQEGAKIGIEYRFRFVINLSCKIIFEIRFDDLPKESA